MLENYEKHPFLDDFYSNTSMYAYETEISFLLLHYHQIKKVFFSNQEDVVSDFYIGKDMLFAKANIVHKKEYELFYELFRHLSGQLMKPDMVIFLSASDELLLNRIKKRGRDTEKNIDLAYIQKINLAYDFYFANEIKDIEVIKINMDECDFLTNEIMIDNLIDEICHGHLNKLSKIIK